MKSWNDIKINQYQKIDTLLQSEIDLFEKQIRLVQLLFNLSENQIDELPINEFNEKYLPETNFIFNTKPESKIPIYFTIDKTKYVFEPRVDNLTAGQYIDLSNLTKESKQIVPNLHLILAVLCRPIKTKFKSDDIEARANLFQKELSVNIAYPIALFFCHLLSNLQTNIPVYLSKEMKGLNKAMEMIIITSERSGDGSQSLTPSQAGMLANGTISQN